MKKLLYTFILSFLVFHSHGQCTNFSSFGSAVAPATVGTSAPISTCNFQTEYSTISNIISGNTYTATNSSGGCITIHSGTPGGPIVAFGNAPLTFTATSSGTYYFHYNTNCTTCGTATFCGTTSVSLSASGGSGGGGGTPCSQNTVVVNMLDSWGDGWNGASYSLINSSGLVVGSGTLSTGPSGSNSFCLPSGCYYMSVTSGFWPTEVSWNITVNGVVAANGGANTSNSLVTVGSCSSAPTPPSLPGIACNGATPFCTGTTYIFPAGVNQPAAPVGPAYGCLFSQPNPVWYFLQVQNPGQLDITLSNSSGADIDFILWGPFSSPFGACLAGLTSSTIVDCSYSGAATEYVNIPNAVTGQYYMLLVTNYSNTNTNFNFAQTSGNATTNCSILCNINAMTAIPGICNSPSNTFNVTGSISTYAPPTSGTLTITPSCGGAPLILYPPFLTTMNYTLTGVQATGAPCAITAQYSADPLCNFTTNITSPSPCTQCNATASNNGPYCIGSPIQLNSTGGGTYSWTGPNGFTSNIQNPTINTTTSASSGNYTVTVSISGVTCSASTTVILNQPVTPTFAQVAAICSGGTFTLPTTSINGFPGSWLPAINNTATTTYTFTPSALQCALPVTQTVTVNQPVTPTFAQVAAICSGGTFTLPTTSINGIPGSWLPAINNTATTTYTFTPSAGQCALLVTQTVSVNQPVTPTFVQVAAICSGGTFTLPATSLNGILGSWLPAINNTATTTYTFSPSAGQCALPATQTVTVNQPVTPTFSADIIYGCAPLTVNFTNTTPNSINCIWTISDGTILTGISTVANVFSSEGCFNVTLSSSGLDGCISSFTESNLVCVEVSPVADFFTDNTILTQDDLDINFINTSTGAVDYIWDFGDNSALNSEENPYHEYFFTESSYTIMLIATSSLGCMDTAYSSITMAEQLFYFIPNTFTPDGDLKNNSFQPVFTSGFDPYNFNMLIFNRWGEILFETNNAAIGWDGTYNGDYVQDGVYTWKIEFKAKENDKKHFLSGHVNLFR